MFKLFKVCVYNIHIRKRKGRKSEPFGRIVEVNYASYTNKSKLYYYYDTLNNRKCVKMKDNYCEFSFSERKNIYFFLLKILKILFIPCNVYK